MSITRLASLLRNLFHKQREERELDAEVRAHELLLADEKIRSGMNPQEAQRQARLELGGVEQVKEHIREIRAGHLLEILFQDVRFGVRMLAKSPAFTAVAVLILALGIGANTAIFTILDAVLLRNLPVPHPEELSILTDPDAHAVTFGGYGGGERSTLAYSEFQYLRDHNDVFSHMFAADSQLAEVTAIVGSALPAAQAHTETIRVRLVSGDYFNTLGITPAAGQFFSPDADRARGGAPVAVISHAYWKWRFGLEPSALGRTIQVKSTSFEIVGVAPPGFFGETVGDVPDAWVPLTMQDAIYTGRDMLSPSPDGQLNQFLWLQAIGRRKSGISNAQANASINLTFKGLVESFFGPSLPEDRRREILGQQLKVQSAARGASTLQRNVGQPLKLLMALVALILLIACANVGNLLLARGAGRQREFVMRLAVGADRGRLIRQLLTESLLIASLGGSVGILLAFWAESLLLRMVQGISTGPASIQVNLTPDLRVLAFTLLLTILTALLFGLFPSLHATSLNLATRMKSGTSRPSGESAVRRFSLSKALVVAQVTFSVVLLVTAGLFVHSLSKLAHANLGYKRENLLLFRVNPTTGGYKGPAISRLYQDLLARISALPGLRGVTASHNGLFSGSEQSDPIAVEGYTPKSGEDMNSRFDHIGPSYFSTLGIPVLLGREITAQDSGSGERAAVINETFVHRFFPNTDPIGRHIRDTYPGNPADCVVMGVVADAKYNSLREKTPPRIYAPLFNPMWAQAQNAAFYEVRTFADPASVTTALRSVVKDVAPSVPPIHIRTMTGLVDDTLQTDRFIQQLSSAFGALAILLASVGLYGVLAYNVARRTREIGIHMALGAAPINIHWQTLRESLVLALLGIALGVPAALGGTRLIRNLLFGLGFADPVALVSAGVILLIVAAIAGFIPARRAMRVDPMVALRYE